METTRENFEKYKKETVEVSLTREDWYKVCDGLRIAYEESLSFDAFWEIRNKIMLKVFGFSEVQ